MSRNTPALLCVRARDTVDDLDTVSIHISRPFYMAWLYPVAAYRSLRPVTAQHRHLATSQALTPHAHAPPNYRNRSICKQARTCLAIARRGSAAGQHPRERIWHSRVRLEFAREYMHPARSSLGRLLARVCSLRSGLSICPGALRSIVAWLRLAQPRTGLSSSCPRPRLTRSV